MKLNRLALLSVALLASSIFQLMAWGHTGVAAEEKRETGCGALRFTYDTSLGHTIVCDDVPQHEILPNEPYWQAHPAYTKIQFSGYPFPNSFGLGPTIYIFPIDDVQGGYRSPFLGEQEDLWLKEVNALEAVLRDRPTWTPPTWEVGEQMPTVPLLPLINAGNIYLAKQQYMSFRNGSGVRYLAQITQDASPPSQEDTFYIFEGISEKHALYNKREYITAIFPAFLAAPQVATTNASSTEQARLIANMLERAESGDFNPDLRLLDDMVASFQVAYPLPPHSFPEDAQPGMPGSGAGNALSFYATALLMAALMAIGGGAALRTGAASGRSRAQEEERPGV
ncbi:MAG TPA: hypothetical protein VF826_06870 [Chloroflexia bacterium]|jgi:hypothetical protein